LSLLRRVWLIVTVKLRYTWTFPGGSDESKNRSMMVFVSCLRFFVSCGFNVPFSDLASTCWLTTWRLTITTENVNGVYMFSTTSLSIQPTAAFYRTGQSDKFLNLLITMSSDCSWYLYNDRVSKPQSRISIHFLKITCKMTLEAVRPIFPENTIGRMIKSHITLHLMNIVLDWTT